MSELKGIQQNFGQHRQDAADFSLRAQIIKTEMDYLDEAHRQQLRNANVQERQNLTEVYNRKRNDLAGRMQQAVAGKNMALENLGAVASAFLPKLNPVEAMSQLSDVFPILLFPLRLEVRFKTTATQQRQLWLRVYPDDCNITIKEELLSESELRNATTFWIEIWKAGGVEAEARGAWRSLVNSHGSGRAAWIIKHFEPGNSAPSKPDAQHKILVITSPRRTDGEHIAAEKYWAAMWLAQGDTQTVSDAYTTLVAETSAAIAAQIQTQYVPVNLSDTVPDNLQKQNIHLENLGLPAYTPKQTSWTESAKAVGLPDKFVVIACQGEVRKTVVFENPVRDMLPVSPDPSLAEDDQIKKDADGNLILNEELQWMIDFDKAVQVGMATRIDLTEQEFNTGFDRLYVTGIRFSSDETASQQLLQKIWADQYQSKSGFGIIRQGTPTNNTEEEASGYSWLDDANESYDRIFGAENLDPAADTSMTDGQKLADALGIEAAAIANIPNAKGRDQLEAYAMNTALFPATLGYFMKEMMDPLFDAADIDATRKFFNAFVSGRGPVPAIRVGRQPYGILPITVFSKLGFNDRSKQLPVSGQYLSKLQALIQKMDTVWESLVPRVSHVGKDGDAHQILLDVVGLHAGSVEFHQRYAQSITQVYNQLSLQAGPIIGAFVALAIAEKGKVILRGLGLNDDLKLPILDKYFLGEPVALDGPYVDDVPLSETKPVRGYSNDGLNYIEWLATSGVEKIRVEDFGGKPQPDALLYLLLRHALTQAQGEAGADILVDKNLAMAKAFYDPDLLHVQTPDKDQGRSKFEALYTVNAAATEGESITIGEYIYKPNILQTLFQTGKLRETIDALNHLAPTPTARLERLLSEHLDCCSYRLDAWKTALTACKRIEQRSVSTQTTNGSKGLYLGAYGVLTGVKRSAKTDTEVGLSPELTEIFNKDGKEHITADSNNLGYIHAPSLNQAATAAILRNAYESHKNTSSPQTFAVDLKSDRVRIAMSFLEGVRNGQTLGALLGYQFERGLHDQSGMDKIQLNNFIYHFRKAFPLVADKLKSTQSTPADSIDTIQANNVTDGLLLITHVQASVRTTYPFDPLQSYTLPAATPAQADVITAEVRKIVGIHDAIGDLVMAEQLYQVVQGNFERASGHAEAFSKGTYPPEMQVAGTPRTGKTITHRVALHFDASALSTSPNAMAMTPRASAEPSVNLWLSSLLPDPDQVRCKVTYANPATAETETEVSQQQLGLQPIDLLYAADFAAEQAMTELDDRITHYIRYTVARHPDTRVTINYTKAIDAANPAKVSFFELGALIKSLKKILIGTKTIGPKDVTVPTDAKTSSTPVLNDILLRTRIQKLHDDMRTVKTSLETELNTISSQAKAAESLKTALQPHIADKTKISALANQLIVDLKNYLTDAATKTQALAALATALAPIGNATIQNNIQTSYENMLDAYRTDFTAFDAQAESCCIVFLQAALFDNVQTGTGFIHQGISGIYNSVLNKLDTVIARWNRKLGEYNDLPAYDPTGDAAEQLELIRKKEMIISSTPTAPRPEDPGSYNTIVAAKVTQFNTLLGQLTALRSNTRDKLTDFFADVETRLQNMGAFDVIPFDTNTHRNDLKAEKLMAAQLKEDFATALQNLIRSLKDKLDGCTALLDRADASAINGEKIKALLEASVLLLGNSGLIIPQFTLPNSQAVEFENAYTASDDILDFAKTRETRLLPVEDWLGGVARTRGKMHHWENISFLVNGFRPANILDVTPLQFPYQEDDRWLAMTFRDNTPGVNDPFEITTDKLLYTAHFASAFDKTKPQCGVIIDEWTEVIPSSQETTGVAFHYDQPSSEPPQTMLLVVPPDLKGHWQWDDLVATLEETLQMAKKRAVEPSQIDTTNYSQFLPSTMIATTLYGITVSLNLARNKNIYSQIKES